jgi:hypothetical protein
MTGWIHTFETWIWNERLFFCLRHVLLHELKRRFAATHCDVLILESIQLDIWIIQYWKYICCSLWRWFRWLEPRTTSNKTLILLQKMKLLRTGRRHFANWAYWTIWRCNNLFWPSVIAMYLSVGTASWLVSRASQHLDTMNSCKSTFQLMW